MAFFLKKVSLRREEDIPMSKVFTHRRALFSIHSHIWTFEMTKFEVHISFLSVNPTFLTCWNSTDSNNYYWLFCGFENDWLTLISESDCILLSWKISKMMICKDFISEISFRPGLACCEASGFFLGCVRIWKVQKIMRRWEKTKFLPLLYSHVG